MTRRASTRRRRPGDHDRDVAVRYRRGTELGDRGALVEALAELLVGRVERQERAEEGAGAEREGRP